LRKPLVELLSKTIILNYTLPHTVKGIDLVRLSEHDDYCFECTNENKLPEIIYNLILEYSFNEYEFDDSDLANLFEVALRTKLRHSIDTDIPGVNHGFFGEVLLYAMLYVFYDSPPLIARGYFYNPLDNAETKGYDSYHLIEVDDKVELWFGEVKFRQSFCCSKTSCVVSAIDGLDKAFSDEYLETTLFELENYRNNFNLKGSKIETILDDWKANASRIKLIEEIRQHNITLVYPVLLVYNDNEPDYDKKIKEAVDKINKSFEEKEYSLSIKYKLFFIFLPVNEVSKIKKEVIEWRESRKPLIS
jgi:hypothetical protein